MVNLTDFRFFKANAGGIVGQAAIGAIALARAEAYAEAMDWACEWVWDECRWDESCADWGCECSANEHTTPIDHEILCCLLKDADGNVLECLGGIIDPDRNYRRVVEAELAAEAIASLPRATYGIGKAA